MSLAFSFRHWWNRADSRAHQVTPQQEEPVGPEAQFRMGLKFAEGEGVVQDYAQAADWYAQAAQQNHSLAQFSLAALYGQGLGVVRDEAQSLKWLTRAANLGNAAAQYRLGVVQHLGCRGGRAGVTPETRIEALKWVQLSAAQDYRGAQSAYEFVALAMTREEVAESARRATGFVPGQKHAD